MPHAQLIAELLVGVFGIQDVYVNISRNTGYYRKGLWAAYSSLRVAKEGGNTNHTSR